MNEKPFTAPKDKVKDLGPMGKKTSFPKGGPNGKDYRKYGANLARAKYQKSGV